jgi:hypothetical protein
VPSELLALWRQASERAALDLDAAHTARRDSFIAFTADERELLRAAIRRQEEELPTRLDALLQQAGPPESRWQAVENVQLPLELLYASWYLSGHEVYTLDDGARIFSALERGDVPLSRWERTIVQAALRADVSRDARWGSTPLFPGS